MLCCIALVLLAVASIQARSFDNPILSDEPYYESSAIKVNGTYYVVARSHDTRDGIFPIHTSTDLMEWALAGYVFGSINVPTWAKNGQLFSPEIHQIGTNYVLYFTGINTATSYYDVGVATAVHPLGPYTHLNLPLLSIPGQNEFLPTIINDEGILYLVWSNSSYVINARQLNEDGTSFSSDQTTTLLKPDLAWEGDVETYPWYIRRGSYHYVMFTGICSGIGVARSTNALGPYEKHSEPIMVPSENNLCPQDPSVVKDLDDKNDIILFNTGVNNSWIVVLASLSWDADDWPYVEDFEICI